MSKKEIINKLKELNQFYVKWHLYRRPSKEFIKYYNYDLQNYKNIDIKKINELIRQYMENIYKTSLFTKLNKALKECLEFINRFYITPKQILTPQQKEISDTYLFIITNINDLKSSPMSKTIINSYLKKINNMMVNYKKES